jgi:hypothetical protein
MENSFDEIRAILAELAISQKDTELKFKETEAQIKANDAMLATRFKETDAKFKELHRQFSDIGLSNGEAAESFFYNSLEDKKMLGEVKFDEIAKNIKQKRH